MISKEDFNKVWKDSSRESILNQFYYEHNDLRELLKENGNKEEVIKNYQKLLKEMEEYIEGSLNDPRTEPRLILKICLERIKRIKEEI